MEEERSEGSERSVGHHGSADGLPSSGAAVECCGIRQGVSPDLPVSAFSVMCKLSQPVSLQGGEINFYSFHSSTMRSY